MDIGHPDQAQDQALLQEQIVPAIVQLAERLEAAEAKIGDCETMITKIITGFKGAATNQRKLQLGNSVREKYGSEFEKLMPMYKHLVGADKDPVTDIVEAVMEAMENGGMDPAGKEAAIEDYAKQILERFMPDNLRKLIDPVAETVAEAPEGSALEIEVSTDSAPIEEIIKPRRKMSAIR